MEQTEDQTNIGSRVLRDLDHSDEIADLPELEGGDFDGGYGSPVEFSESGDSVTDGQPLVERRSQPWLETGDPGTNDPGTSDLGIDDAEADESSVVSEAGNRLDSDATALDLSPGSAGDAWPSLTGPENEVALSSVHQLDDATVSPGDLAVDHVAVGDVAVADVADDVAARESAEVDLLDRPTLDGPGLGSLDLIPATTEEANEAGITAEPSPDASDEPSESQRRSCRICSSQVSQINIKVDGNTLILESCDQCDARRWRLDGQPIDLQQALDEVGEHTGRRQ